MSLPEDLQRRVDALPAVSKPVAVWLMDIDGVLNLTARPPRHGWPAYRHVVVVRDSHGIAWEICYAPLLMSLLTQLHTKNIVSFRWLTTWEYDGPLNFAPAVSLNIGQWVAAVDRGELTWWKLDAFVQTLGSPEELPIIWTDDEIAKEAEAQRILDMVHGDDALAFAPNERVGITPENFELIVDYIEACLRQSLP
jgi:hypothetical protein